VNQRGFTLAELLVSVAVVGMVMAGALVLQQQGQLAYLWGSARVEAQQNARLALDLMTRELRSALSLTTVGTCNNAANGTNTITFRDASDKAVTYALTGAAIPFTLRRTYDGAASDLIGGVSRFQVFCYNTDGYTLESDLTRIGSVRVVIQTQSETPSTSGSLSAQRATLESRVKLRNL
jgi:prepilin-type N-terminal cleavage/methylation domain-containing protein